MPRQIYLDHNACTNPAPEVIEAVREAMEGLWANPSSVHRFGQRVRQRVELARESVGRLIGCEPAEIVFTSGGTESTNLAILGGVRRQRPERNVIITTPVEHVAVREPIDALGAEGWTVVRLAVDSDGVVSVDELRAALAANAGRIALVSIQWANNETGVIEPVEVLAAEVKANDRRILFHTDAIQCVGKIAVDLRAAPGIDLLSFAGHKFHGPTGAGGLFVRRGVRLAPLILGGPHERQRRGGTENAAGIIGLGVAAELARKRLESADRGVAKAVEGMRDEFEERILARIPDSSVNGATARHGRVWNTSNIAFDRLEAEAVLLLLSERGVCASAGAACSSGSLDPSPVLLAMGVPETKAHGSVRFSFSHETTREELAAAGEIIEGVIARLRETLPVGRA